jgi:PAS domain-containing protein
MAICIAQKHTCHLESFNITSASQGATLGWPQPEVWKSLDFTMNENTAQQTGRPLGDGTHYHLLFDNSLDALMLTAPDGSVLDANPSACRILGRSREEILQGGREAVIDTSDPQ